MNHWSDEPDALDPFTRPLTTITVLRRENPAVAALEEHNHALAVEVGRLEDRLAVAHRRLARQSATIRRLRRNGPRWWETLAAFASDRLDRFSDWTRGWYL